jgi:phosphoribosylformylglycinamidine (FGAM) synthase PurS component
VYNVSQSLVEGTFVKVTVLLERLDERKYRASTSQPISLEVEAGSREDAVERLREVAQKRLANVELVELSLPEVREPNPWVSFAGVWKDHPDFDAFRENIAEYRRKVDEAAPLP